MLLSSLMLVLAIINLAVFSLDVSFLRSFFLLGLSAHVYFSSHLWLFSVLMFIFSNHLWLFWAIINFVVFSVHVCFEDSFIFPSAVIFLFQKWLIFLFIVLTFVVSNYSFGICLILFFSAFIFVYGNDCLVPLSVILCWFINDFICL